MHTLIKEQHSSIDDQNIVFIVDESHRSTGGSNQSDTEGMVPSIKKAFKHSAWIGYTRSPLILMLKKDLLLNKFLALAYIDVISDHNVLGFKVYFQNNLPQSTLYVFLFS